MDLNTIDLNDLGQLQKLQRALNELGAPDRDEGARLHAEKNAPSVSGQYSHLKFPAYTYHPYPRDMYSPDYPAAREALTRAQRIPARSMETGERDAAVIQAERELRLAVMSVGDEAQESDAKNRGWSNTPDEAKAACERRARGVAQAAAEANYDDRHLGEKARAEREAIDADHDGHLVEVPETPRAGARTRVAVGK